MTAIEKTIALIENVDLHSETAISELHSIISSRLGGLPLFMTDIKVGEPLVRARKLENNEDFHHLISDYSYPPDTEKIKVGRANLKGQQIFYGARFRITALAEVRFIYANREKDFAHYSLGLWEAKEKLSLAAIVTPESIRKNNSQELFELADFIESAEKKYRNNSKITGFLDFYRFMANKYREPVEEGEEHKYKITAAFSDFILSTLPTAAGILYQSVQYPQNFNVALRKEVKDTNTIVMTNAARQKYIRTGEKAFQEDESVLTNKIDYEAMRVRW